MSDYIPAEVVQEILLRLPPKSLMKCTAVCNSWKFLIKSPAFIDTLLLRRTIQSEDSHLLLLNAVTHVSEATNEYYSLHNPENVRPYTMGLWEVEVYSLARGSWKTLTSANPPIGFVGVKDLVSVFVNGALRWFRYGKESGVVGKNNFITVFDMLSEQFSEMLVPQALTVQYDDIRISKYAKLLAFIQIACLKRNNVIRIWVVEEYGVMKSWTKLFTIDLKQLSGLILKPFGFRRNGEILVDVPAVGLHSVDPKSGQAKLIRCEGVKWYCFVDSFVESRSCPTRPSQQSLTTLL